jgi:hypothetical protein
MTSVYALKIIPYVNGTDARQVLYSRKTTDKQEHSTMTFWYSKERHQLMLAQEYLVAWSAAS